MLMTIPHLKNNENQKWGENTQLALDTLAMRPTKGIPHGGLLHLMGISEIEYFAGHAPGDYLCDVDGVYLDFQHKIGTGFIDQYIPENPLTMTDKGFDENTERRATTGLEDITVDGIKINSPEAVVEHLERFVFPELENRISLFDVDDPEKSADLIAREQAVQKMFGADIVKTPYNGFYAVPRLHYSEYGYINYFMAYALYPEIIEKDFQLQADMAKKTNAIAARAIREGGLPPVVRLDHDMADSRGTLVDIKTLDTIWFPHFSRAIKPHLDFDIRLLWYCDGNLMQMVPRLIESGVSGFQGFQYEDGMDYEKICRMTDRNGNPLMIWAGISVTTTLPMGSPKEIKAELKWLVDNGPEVGLVLSASSSITPGVKRQNLETFFEGLQYYQTHGRD